MTIRSARQIGRYRPIVVFAFAFILFAHPSSGQSVGGVVTSSDGEPLNFVQVVAPALQQGTTTIAEGRYLIDKLPFGPLEIEFRFLGFRTERRIVEVVAGNVELNVTLSPEAIELEGTVITAESLAESMLKRSTQSVTIMEPEDLREVQGQTLGETLSRLPGVTTLTTGPSIAKPVIRGLHSQRLVIMNAGIAQEGQQWGGEHAPEIDPFSAGRIEIIRGAAGVEYGIGAIGGVIRVEPDELPEDSSMAGRVSLNGFSNNSQGAGSLMLQMGVPSIPGVGFRIQGSFRKAGDSRTRDYVIGNSGFEEISGSLTLGIHRPRMGARLHISHFGTTLALYKGAHIGNAEDLIRAIERGQPSVDYSFGYSIDAPKQRISHELISLNAHFQLGSGDWIDAQYGFQFNSRSEFDAHRRFSDPSEDPAFSLDLDTHSLEIKLRQAPRGAFLGVAGISLMTQGNSNGESGFLIPNFRSNTIGTFVRETWISNRLTLEAGLRYDHRWLDAWPRERLSSGPFVKRSDDYGSASAVLGAIYQFGHHWSLSGNFGLAWRPPGVNELFNFGVHHGTAQFEVGDPDLDGERSLNTDITIRHIDTDLTLEFSLYNNLMNGYIFLTPENEPRVTIRGTFPSFRYAQTDAVLRGIDGYILYSLTDRLSVEAQLSLVRGRDRSNNKWLIFMPADRGRLEISYALPEWGRFEEGRVHAGITHVAEQTRFPEGVDYAEPPGAYSHVSIGYRTSIRTASVLANASLEVANLFDVRHRDYLSRFRYFIDDPGRNIILRLQIPFGSVD